MMSLTVRFLDGTAQQVDVPPETTFADLMSRIKSGAVCVYVCACVCVCVRACVWYQKMGLRLPEIRNGDFH